MPSHAFVHLVEIGCQVTICGLTVQTNDIIHADQHGAVMVPAEVVTKIPDAIELITRREAVILDSVKAAGFNIEKLKIAMGQSRDIH